MVLNFTRSLCVATSLLFPAFPAVMVNTSCGVGAAGAGGGPLAFNLICPAFTVTGTVLSNSPGNDISAFVHIITLDIAATAAGANGFFEFTSDFNLPVPKVFGTKFMAGAFIDPTGDDMDSLSFNAFIGGMAFMHDAAIGPTLLADDHDIDTFENLAFAGRNGGGAFTPAVPYWLTGSLAFNLTTARDEIDPTYGVEVAPIPEAANWGLMSLGTLVISGIRMFRDSRQRDAMKKAHRKPVET